jgi:tetratricopeptide (TPR) repeat protein
MKARTILPGLMLLSLICAIAVPAWAQTAKPAAPSHRSPADLAARKQFAAYMVDFRANPNDTELRDKIVALAKTLKPAPLVPPLVRAEFAKAAAQLKAASTAEDFKAAAGLFEQVAQQAPWYADAYFNAASAYAQAADYDSAKRDLAIYMAAVRPGVDTQSAETLESDIAQKEVLQQEQVRQQQALQQFQQVLQQFRANPSDSAREQIIKQAQAMKTPPAIPEEGREHYAMAQEFAEKAKNDTERAKDDSDLKLANAGFERAVREYKAALQAAPWWADAYKKLALAQKAAGQYDDAIASLNLYLLSQPADARDAQDEIYKLRADKQAAAEKKAAEEKRKWEEENSPQAIAAREQQKFASWLKNLDGVLYSESFYDDDERRTITYTLQIRGNNAYERTNSFRYGEWGDYQTYRITGRTFEGMKYQNAHETFTISEDGETMTQVTVNDDGRRSDVTFRRQ